MSEKTTTKKKEQKFEISLEKCVGCSYCKLNCPDEAIVVTDAIARRISDCNLCSICSWVCPVQAISIV